MNGWRRIMPLSTVRISGSGRLKTWTWVVAIPGPETISSAIRSRPIPVSLNRPSAPVVVAIETSRSRGARPSCGQGLGRATAFQALPEVAGGAVAGLGDPAGEVAFLVVPDPGGLDAGAGDGPALEVDDPPFDRRPFLDERDHLLGGPVGTKPASHQPTPYPGAEATSQGYMAR